MSDGKTREGAPDPSGEVTATSHPLPPSRHAPVAMIPVSPRAKNP